MEINYSRYKKLIKKHFFIANLLVMLFCQVATAQNKKLENKIQLAEKQLKESKTKLKQLTLLDSLIIWYEDDNYNSKIEAAYKKFEKLSLEVKSNVNYARLIHNSNIITNYYLSILNKPLEAMELSNKVKKWINYTNSNEVIGNYHNERGSIFYNLNQNDSAIYYNQKAQKYYRRLNNKNNYFLSKSYEATSLVDMGEHAAATIILDSCFAFYVSKKDTLQMFDALNSKNIILSKLNLYEETSKNNIKLKKYAQGNATKLVLLHINQGTDEGKQNNRNGAVDNYKLALKYAEKSEYVEYLKPIILSALAQKLFEYGNLEEGKKYFDIIATNYDITNESFSKYYRDAKVELLILTKQYNEALDILLRQKEEVYKSKNAEQIRNLEKQIATVYEFLQDDKNAIFHFKNFYHLKDSLDNIAKLNSLFYYESLYENQKSENTIKEQVFKISDLSQKNDYQRAAIIGLLVVGLLIVTLGFLGFKQFQSKKENRLKAAFSQDLIQMQEQQRNRLALELHDGIGQRLTLLKQKLQSAQQVEASQITAQILEETRAMSRDLYPAFLNQVGITEALKAMIDDIDASTEMFFTHEIDNIDDMFTKDQALNIYRFIQESLGNIIKHSKAKEAFIVIKKETNALKIEIEDNGIGFDVNAKLQYSKSMGIKTMKERINMLKGILNIKSIQGKFTHIEVILNT
jgi:signal transduction histidine kinase